jgi:hypothetical protein
MMDKEILISIDIVWTPEDPEGQNCKLCQDPIFGKAWRLSFWVNKNSFSDTETVICSNCYEHIPPEDK